MIGGNMVPCLESLYQILGNNTLFGISNKIDKMWTNLESGKIIFNGKYKINNIKYKIALLISNKTASSGEIITSAFIGRENCIIIGTHKYTYGQLSNNDYNPLKNNYDLYLTIGRITTINGKLMKNEKIKADIVTNTPIYRAKQWFK